MVLRSPFWALCGPMTTPRPKPGGAFVNACAALSNRTVRVWEYLPERWCADAAVKLYEGPIIAALRKHRGTSVPYCRMLHYVRLRRHDKTGTHSLVVHNERAGNTDGRPTKGRSRLTDGNQEKERCNERAGRTDGRHGRQTRRVDGKSFKNA